MIAPPNPPTHPPPQKTKPAPKKQVQEEERHHNENALITLTCDSVSLMVGAVLVARDIEGREALTSTFGRLFEGLSDIAKAVGIILVADTMLGYHSEEGWTSLIDIVLGHYGIEVEEKDIVLFVGIIPIAIDVAFKYWIFKVGAGGMAGRVCVVARRAGV